MSGLRIERGVRVPERTALGARTALRGKYITRPDEFATRLTKLIPADIVGLYLAGRTVAANSNLAGAWILICLAIVLLARALLTREKAQSAWFKGTQWDVVAYSAISYLIWVYAIGGERPPPLANYVKGVDSLMALAWPVIASYLVLLPGDGKK